MPNIIEVLKAELINDTSSDYAKHQNTIENVSSNLALDNFLSATVDEVRLYWANKYADSVLLALGMPELSYFRKAVIRRELFGDIDYLKQRDHAAHTTYNYLIGWLLFLKNTHLKEKLFEAFKIRDPREVSKLNEGFLFSFFGDIWPYVSLLHDIGYLFEGSIEALNPDVQSRKIAKGAAVLNDFFQHSFWKDIKISSSVIRSQLMEMSNVDLPNFKNTSIASVGTGIRFLGDLEILREKILRDSNARGFPIFSAIETEDGIPSDSFDLWSYHYEIYEKPNMAKLIRLTEQAYNSLIWDGLPNSGLRLLDHGVCSGLILLLFSSFWFRIFAGLKPSTVHKNPFKQKIKNMFIKDTVPEHINPSVVWWWACIPWATAATAIHNILQMPSPWPGCENGSVKLDIEEDPLAYLGILVDILQEWDRYSVLKESIITGILPIQGTDIEIEFDNDIVIWDFQNDARTDKVIKALNRALLDWDKIVQIK